MKYMPEPRRRMNKTRRDEIMLGAILNNPIIKNRLRSCATKRRTKESESRVQPAASSPSLKKDFTFTDMRKHENVPTKSNMHGNPQGRTKLCPPQMPNKSKLKILFF
jgi:hypothetical protein